MLNFKIILHFLINNKLITDMKQIIKFEMKMKRMKTILMVILMCMGSLGARAQYSFSGTGTAADPFQIRTAEDLDNVPQFYNAGKHFLLMNDIDLTAYLAGSTEGWLPICSQSGFDGYFHGGGNKITGLRINRSDDDYVALFGINRGTIENLTVEVISIVANRDVAGLVGRNFGNINQCSVSGGGNGSIASYGTGSLVGYPSYVGGLIGTNAGGTVINCYTQAIHVSSITASEGLNCSGGLIGQNYSGTVNYCYSTGNSVGVYSGGLIGYNYLGTVSNCYATGYSQGLISGGLIGVLSGGTVKSCYATSSSVAYPDFFYRNEVPLSGGLIGYISLGTVSNCYAAGSSDAVVDEVLGFALAGGLIGGIQMFGEEIAYDDRAVVSKCYAVVPVSGYPNSQCGALVAKYADNVCSHFVQCYYANGRYDDCGTLSYEMTEQATFEGWDFDKIWDISSGAFAGYPYPTLRMLSSDATLKSLIVQAGIATYDFVSVNILINVANNIDKVTFVDIIPNHAEARVTSNILGEQALAIGITVFEIEVTAEDGTTQIHTLSFNRETNDSDATLQDISVSQGELSPVFDAGIETYTVNVANTIENITLTATATHPEALVTGDGTMALQVGGNNFNIVVTAKDGETQKTYTVIVTRAKSSDATLGSLIVSSGSSSFALSPVFNASTTSYTATVYYDIHKITLTAVANHTEANVTGTGEKMLGFGENIFDVTVIAEDQTEKIYNVKIIRDNLPVTIESVTGSSAIIVVQKSIPDANGYTLTICDDELCTDPICKMDFDANGNLSGVDILRSGNADSNFSYTIENLSSGTTYYYTLKVFDTENVVLTTQTGEFTTAGTTGVAETQLAPQPEIIGYYNILGVQLPQAPEKGVYIIVYDNGTVEKVVR